jgi:hypothetical protein
LSFFVRSIYTDEEIGELPTDHARTLINGRKDGGEGPSSGGRNASNSKYRIITGIYLIQDLKKAFVMDYVTI